MRTYRFSFVILGLIAVTALAKSPNPKHTGTPPGVNMLKVGHPGPWLNLKDIYTPGEEMPVTNPVGVDTVDEKNFDPNKYKVFINKVGAADMWELSPLLMSGATYDIPQPVGKPKPPPDVEGDDVRHGAHAILVAATVPQLPLGSYEVWQEQAGVKGPVKAIQIRPKLTYSIIGKPESEKPSM